MKILGINETLLSIILMFIGSTSFQYFVNNSVVIAEDITSVQNRLLISSMYGLETVALFLFVEYFIADTNTRIIKFCMLISILMSIVIYGVLMSADRSVERNYLINKITQVQAGINPESENYQYTLANNIVNILYQQNQSFTTANSITTLTSLL